MSVKYAYYGVLAVLLGAGCARAGDTVTVIQLNLAYNEVRSLPLNDSVEYILELTPQEDASEAPSVVWLHSDGGESARPVLVTARQRAGAVTWQLPYASGSRQLFELERTLCPGDCTAVEATDCGGAGAARGSLSLHVSTACAAPLTVSVRVARPPAWRLPFHSPLTLLATQEAPRVTYYQFEEGQNSVRLVADSESSVCATLSVQNYSCPIAQTPTEVSTSGLRLTMMLSGAVQLSRHDFPNGFFVVALVWDSEEACGAAGAGDEGEDWLFDAVFQEAAPRQTHVARLRKDFTLTVQPALTRGQYAAAAVVTLAVFLGFYLVFGALVLAQRWPPFAQYVLPKAVLAADEPAASTPDPNATEQAQPPSRRRHSDSVATFDSSDDSDSEDEYDSVPAAASTPVADTRGARVAGDAGVAGEGTAGGAADAQEDDTQGPFGLPARLRVAALARRRARTLRARSDRYLYMLYTVAVFYALPVVQFVIAFQIILNVSGSLDICYYNFLCAHRAGALSDFNHVLSNAGYLLLGALFLLQVRRRRRERRVRPRHQEYGIPAHYGLLSALGAGMMVVAVLSASYHVCPNRLNFQFDTAFMYVLAVLMMVKIYQSRHPDVNARAHATFGVLAVLIAAVVWGVLGGGPVFWGFFTVLHVFTFLLLSLRIYYVGQFRLEKESLAMAASELRKGAPHYRARLVLLLIANAVNWLFAIYGLLSQGSDFAGHMLSLLLGNALMYMVFYLAMKLLHGERLRWYAWALLAGAAACWLPALYFFVAGSSDWSAAPALSRHKNHECKVMQFYDSHDLWHMLSAAALYLTFSALLAWDDGLSAVKRTDIPVF